MAEPQYAIYVSRTPGCTWILEGWCRPWGKLVIGTREEVERWLANAWKIPDVNYEVRPHDSAR